jgi:hypothetical protein
MDPILLKIVHLAGVFTLFTALGAILLADSHKKIASILHGISLIIILGAGFAMLKKPPMDQYWWMAKLGIWLFLGVAPTLAKRKIAPPVVLALAVIACGVVSAWLGLMKPF